MPYNQTEIDDLNDCLEQVPDIACPASTGTDARRAVHDLSNLMVAVTLDECEMTADLPNYLENQTIKSGF